MAVAGYFILGFGLLLVLLNWSMPVASAITKRHHSMVPPLGGLLCFVGCALAPALSWKLGLALFVLDPGFIVIVLALVYFATHRPPTTD